MGEKKITSRLIIDETTDVAFVDVSEGAPNARVDVASVSDLLGLRGQVLARIDVENGVVLGLIIDGYSAFRREIMMKYMMFRMKRIIDLLVSAVTASVARRHAEKSQLAAV